MTTKDLNRKPSPRPVIIPLRLSLAEREDLRRGAERKGIPVSTFIRMTAVKAARRAA